MTSTIIKTNGEVVNVEPKNGTDFKLAELQKIASRFVPTIDHCELNMDSISMYMSCDNFKNR